MRPRKRSLFWLLSPFVQAPAAEYSEADWAAYIQMIMDREKVWVFSIFHIHFKSVTACQEILSNMQKEQNEKAPA